MFEPQAISSQTPIESISGTLALAKEASQRGAADAREAAVRTWTAAGRLVNRLVYTSCYTASYGLVFPAVMLARCIPMNNSAVRGVVDGANAARQKLDEVYPPTLASV